MAELCLRSREVEALFDNRLDAASASELLAHTAGCAACRRMRASLEAIRSSLRETAETPNAFVMKRLRRELLEKADAGIAVTRARPSFARFALAFAALTFVLAALGGVRAWLRTPPEVITVMAAPGAQFSREEAGETEIVRLTDGTFDFDVHAHAGGRRLLVVVPDGEIEDIGTQFRVVVQHGATVDISVSSGEVVFRKIGADPLRLIAGMTYRPLPAGGQAAPEAELAASATASARAAVSSAMSAAPLAQTSSLPKMRLPDHQRERAAVPSPAATSAASPAASSAASPAVSSAAASAALPSLALSARGGPAAEDLAYMAVVRSLRTGETDAARAGARAYLRDFPNGLRRIEMTAISRSGGLSP